MPFTIIDLLVKWRDTKKITDQVFKKIARENAIKLLGLEAR
jgi:predicted TIM-barrel fold metal-dependent hydrolase